MINKHLVLVIFAIAFTACSNNAPKVVLEEREPEAATGRSDNRLQTGNHFMVAAANPYAVEAGRQIIEQGGSAIDAAVAVQAMLTLVEPQSSGIGGGAFIMYWDNQNKQLHTFDGREIAPKLADPYMFTENNIAMRWRDAVVGGKSVGVPGVLKALEQAQAQFGQLPWKSLFASSIAQSEEGFVVSPRLSSLLSFDLHPGIHKFAETSNYFQPNGKFLENGVVRKNPALAATLSKIAKDGTKAFYTGDIAKHIVEAVNSAPVNPGLLSVEDMQAYEVVERPAMCNPYREYTICSMAPPSSGGVSVYQILKLLEPINLAQYEPDSSEFVHLYAQASALAYADRNHYIADLDYMNVSAAPLVDENYLSSRASGIGIDKMFSKATHGLPYANQRYGEDNALELDSTSHISIIDKQGNAVSMTTSIEFMFGSGIMVDGFLLNNQLTDFALDPMDGENLVLNRVQPHKRPRSAMSPTMVFDSNNELVLVVGSPGGSRIISYVAQTIINVLDFDMDVQAAISAPRITNRNGETTLEKGTNIVNLQAQLEKLGHKVGIRDLNSGLHAVQIKQGNYLGGADPRREGEAVGN